MKRFGILACAIAMTLTCPARAEDFTHEIEQAKGLTAKDGRAVKESDIDSLKHISTLEEQKGKYVDECGKSVTPKIAALNLGEKLKGTRAIIVQDGACYAPEENSITVLDGNDRILWQDNATSIAVLSSKNQAVNDLAFAMGGATRSVWRWSGDTHAYEHVENIEVSPEK
ncbi:hypothetical protein [Acetobacter conturbans]|uniref:Uncharacterized protein n=1 Tax=Acetobacter conturbans TaxID=1737472 RepID=A0ABX0JYW0_9PROT|nr:hypothetical protein [Acetobacter conturbans]NHN88697.1 hypothetical protein [Acetobacter conturbans]